MLLRTHLSIRHFILKACTKKGFIFSIFCCGFKWKSYGGIIEWFFFNLSTCTYMDVFTNNKFFVQYLSVNNDHQHQRSIKDLVVFLSQKQMCFLWEYLFIIARKRCFVEPKKLFPSWRWGKKLFSGEINFPNQIETPLRNLWFVCYVNCAPCGRSLSAGENFYIQLQLFWQNIIIFLYSEN